MSTSNFTSEFPKGFFNVHKQFVFDNNTHLTEDLAFRRIEENYVEEYENSPVECSTLRIAALALLVLFFASLISNALLLRMFCTYKHLKTPMSTFVVALTVLNLIGTLAEFPLVILSNLLCK